MKLIVPIIFGLLLTSAAPADGQAWREIKPIESTVEDVRRLLGEKAICRIGECEYKIPKGGTVYIGLSVATCKDVGSGKFWDIPPGTVTYVQAHNPDNNLFISDLDIDESKLIPVDPGDQLGLEIWESRELGIRIDAGKDKRVAYLEYFPATKYDNILCPSTAKPKPKPLGNRH